MRPHPRDLVKVVFAVLIFTIPPILYGLTSLFSHVSQMLVPPDATHPQSPLVLAQPVVQQWLNTPDQMGQRPAVRAATQAKKKIALIVLGRSGTQASEILLAASTLSAKGWVVATVAPELQWVMTTGSVMIFPDYPFADAPAADALIFPGSLDYKDPRVADWIRTQWRQPRQPEFVLLSEAGRVVAPAQILDNQSVLPHPMALKELKKLHKKVQWVESDRMWTRTGRLTSGVGLASTPKILEDWIAQVPVDQAPVIPTPEVRRRDLARIFFESGFTSERPVVGLYLEDQIPDVALAAWVDSLPRTLRCRVLPFGSDTVIRTQAGLRLLPLGGKLSPDQLATPPNALPEKAVDRGTPTVATWIRFQSPARVQSPPSSSSIPTPTHSPAAEAWVRDFHWVSTASAARESLRWIALQYGRTTLEFIERVSAVPVSERLEIDAHLPKELPELSIWRLLWKPTLFGAAGLLLVWSLRRRWRSGTREETAA